MQPSCIGIVGKYEQMPRVTYRIIRLPTVEIIEHRVFGLHFKRKAKPLYCYTYQLCVVPSCGDHIRPSACDLRVVPISG
jgi:hypothetical protein